MQFLKRFQNINSALVLLGLILIAGALRLFHLDFQSLWLDEIYTMNMAQPSNSWMDIYNLSFINDPLSVLYFILLNSFFKLVGYTAFNARLFSTLMGLLSVYLIYLLGKEIKNKTTGLIAALFLALNYFHIFYSQEARVYTMYMCASIFSFLFLYKFLKAPTKTSAVLYGISVLLLLLSHFFGFFALAGQLTCIFIFALVQKKVSFIKYGGLTALGLLVTLIGYLPVIPIFIMLSKSKGTWIAPPEADAFLKLFKEFHGNSMLLSAVFAILILFAFVTYFRTHSNISTSESSQLELKTHRMSLVFLSTWILIAFLIPFLLSILRFPIFHSRYMISFLPAFILIAAIGFDAIPRFGLRAFLTFIIVFYSFYNLFSTRAYYKTLSKSDFRGVSQFVVDHCYEKPLVLTTLPYHFEYYFREQNGVMEFRYDSPIKYLDDMRVGTAEKRAFWWVDAHGREFKLDSAAMAYLDNNFKVLTEFSGFDAWAKYFVPKDQENSRLLLRIKGSDLVPNSENIANELRQLYRNGRLEKIVDRLDTGKYELLVKATGEPRLGLGGRKAMMRLKINQMIDTIYCPSDRSFLHGDLFRFKQKTLQPLTISVEFLNDTVEKNRDLNLLIREIDLLKQL